MGVKGVASGIVAIAVALVAAIGQSATTVEEPRYNTASAVHESGTVMEVKEAPVNALLSGVHLFVDTGKGRLESYLAPASFLQEIGFKLDKHLQIHLYGSKVKVGADFILLVREVSQDSSTWYLRDEQGNPYWNAGASPAPNPASSR